jgi:hypothetical protein
MTTFGSCHIQAKLENGYSLGDRGYTSQSYLLTPIGNPVIPSKQTFHISTRNCIERTYDILKRRSLALKYYLCIANNRRHVVNGSLRR